MLSKCKSLINKHTEGQDKEGENDIKLILSHLGKPEKLKILKLTDKYPQT